MNTLKKKKKIQFMIKSIVIQSQLGIVSIKR